MRHLKSPKCVIVSSKALGTDCWSARRFTGHCYQCRQVDSKYAQCPLPEAKVGRVVKAQEKVRQAQEHLDKVQKELAQREKELAT